MTRDDRQEVGIQAWLKNKGKGSFIYATGVGKTISALKIIKRSQIKSKTFKVIVIVPKVNLKSQWEEEAIKFGVSIEVYVVNTIVLKKQHLVCDLLILDEAHRFGNDIITADINTFVQIFNLISYSFILNLTATIERLDGLHQILIEHAPVVDTITMEEARSNGWVSDYVEFNLRIQLLPIDKHKYKEINDRFNKANAWMCHDFEIAKKVLYGNCVFLNGEDRNKVISLNQPPIGVDVSEITKDKETKNYIRIASNGAYYYKQNFAKVYAKQMGFDEKETLAQAAIFHKSIRDRKKFLYECKAKLIAAKQIIESCNFKTISFSESTKFATELKNLLPDICVDYHTKIESEKREINGKLKKVSGAKIANQNLYNFKENVGNIRVLSAAKALDEGANIHDVELGLICSYTSSTIQSTQRTGRVVRLLKSGANKTAIIINMYVENSQEEKWY